MDTPIKEFYTQLISNPNLYKPQDLIDIISKDQLSFYQNSFLLLVLPDLQISQKKCIAMLIKNLIRIKYDSQLIGVHQKSIQSQVCTQIYENIDQTAYCEILTQVLNQLIIQNDTYIIDIVGLVELFIKSKNRNESVVHWIKFVYKTFDDRINCINKVVLHLLPDNVDIQYRVLQKMETLFITQIDEIEYINHHLKQIVIQNIGIVSSNQNSICQSIKVLKQIMQEDIRSYIQSQVDDICYIQIFKTVIQSYQNSNNKDVKLVKQYIMFIQQSLEVEELAETADDIKYFMYLVLNDILISKQQFKQFQENIYEFIDLDLDSDCDFIRKLGIDLIQQFYDILISNDQSEVVIQYINYFIGGSSSIIDTEWQKIKEQQIQQGLGDLFSLFRQELGIYLFDFFGQDFILDCNQNYNAMLEMIVKILGNQTNDLIQFRIQKTLSKQIRQMGQFYLNNNVFRNLLDLMIRNLQKQTNWAIVYMMLDNIVTLYNKLIQNQQGFNYTQEQVQLLVFIVENIRTDQHNQNYQFNVLVNVLVTIKLSGFTPFSDKVYQSIFHIYNIVNNDQLDENQVQIKQMIANNLLNQQHQQQTLDQVYKYVKQFILKLQQLQQNGQCSNDNLNQNDILIIQDQLSLFIAIMNKQIQNLSAFIELFCQFLKIDMNENNQCLSDIINLVLEILVYSELNVKDQIKGLKYSCCIDNEIVQFLGQSINEQTIEQILVKLDSNVNKMVLISLIQNGQLVNQLGQVKQWSQYLNTCNDYSVKLLVYLVLKLLLYTENVDSLIDIIKCWLLDLDSQQHLFLEDIDQHQKESDVQNLDQKYIEFNSNNLIQLSRLMAVQCSTELNIHAILTSNLKNIIIQFIKANAQNQLVATCLQQLPYNLQKQILE